MTSEELLALIPDRPLVVYTHAGQRGIWMDDRGDLRFVASCNDNRGDYTTVLAAAPTALRDALAEVARLTAEVERLSAMVPRWSFDAPGRGELMMGECRIGSVVRMSPGDWSAWATDVDGTAWQYVCRAQTAESACAAVCTRLGMPYISPPTENT